MNTNKKVIFVLGGPGSGKGTLCSRIEKELECEHYEHYLHLSVGELLRKEKDNELVKEYIKEGKIVPSFITINLLKNYMLKSDNNKFLIDGFPRNEENKDVWEKQTDNFELEYVLYLECDLKTMIDRIMNRNENRSDDNIETFRKRIKVFDNVTMPVINYYEKKEKLVKIDATQSAENVFEIVKNILL